MGKTITIDELPGEIKKILDEYEGEISSELPTITRKIGMKGAQALRNASKIFKGTGKYAKGWGVTTEHFRYKEEVTIHHKTLPGLPHLLENGHANRNGGRTQGKVHIAPVEQKLIREFEQGVINVIK